MPKSLLLCILWPALVTASSESAAPEPRPTEPGTFELASVAALREVPGGRIAAVWSEGARFTSNAAAGNWLRVSGHFPNTAWEPLERELWIRSEYVFPIQPRRAEPRSPEERYIIINKHDFRLEVFEKQREGDVAVLSTRVALGMDRCLPAAKGGKCYYTEPGEYQVRWKVHDPEGIEWCIPKSMEAEYAEDLARGQRCFRGAIGTLALNIGKTYAIHGTSNPRSIGRRVSHGCIRVRNREMEKLYALMDVDDKVYIVEGDRGRALVPGAASPDLAGTE